MQALDARFSLRSMIYGRMTLFLIVLTAMSTPLFAQTLPHPSFRQYTTDDGLASPEAYHVLQDWEGYIWISTDNGVSRFDGYRFRNYGLKEGLVENVIFMMQLDTLGRVWMQAMSGNLYYMEGDTIRPYWNNEVLLGFKDRPDTGRGFIVEGAGETVHAATLKYGILSISEDTIITYNQEEPIYSQIFEKNKKAIYARFIQDEAEPLQAYKNTLLKQKRCYPAYFYIDGDQWSVSDLAYTSDKVYNPEGFRLGEGKYLYQMYRDIWFIEKGKMPEHHYFPLNILYASLMNNGQLFIGLYGHQGLRVFESITAFGEKRGANWLPNKSVNYFMEDKEGGRWFATHEDGVFYTSADACLVHDVEAGLPDNKVRALAIKNENELFIGLENGEVWGLNSRFEKWKKLPVIPGIGAISDLYFDQQNQQLWVGRGELYYLKNDQWIHTPSSHPEMSFVLTKRISKSPDGKRLWLTHFRGFLSIELPAYQPANIHFGKDQRTLAVTEDYSGNVWVGKPKGLFEWVDNTLVNRQYLHPTFSLRVEDIVLLADSTLVVATKGGGLVFWKEDQFEQISTEQGLTADMLEGLYADGSGTVWAATLNGLNRISGTWGNRKVEQITVFHGLPSNEISRIGSTSNKVWVGTNKGLVYFSNKPTSHSFPKPKLTSVLANNQPLDLAKPIRLNAQENNLGISFLAINYRMNGKIPYRYRMDNGVWTLTSNLSVNFLELPPGERLFEVQAKNEDGIWSESVFLSFIIAPPWWGTWWARSFFVLLVVLMGVGVYKYRTRQVKQEHQIQMQIAELERSALQAQMNPHFIFNCLNSIQNFILLNDKKAAILYLGSFASLVRSMLNASVAGKILLSEEVRLLNNYLELEKLRFKNRFTYEVYLAKDLDASEIKIPPLLVQPYVENAVKHGIFGKDIEGKVTVFFEKKNDFLEVSILDNGVGIKSKNGEKENATSHKSFGMSITKNRLELLLNRKEYNAVNSKTLYDEEGQISGTKVTIYIWI